MFTTPKISPIWLQFNNVTNQYVVLSLIKINYKINRFHVIKNEKHNVNIEETMMSVMLFVVWTINKKGVI